MSRASLRGFASNVLAMAYREATVMRHDKAFMAVVTVQPLMMLLLFGGALSNKPANVPWAVLDHSRTQLSRQLVSDIEATGYFVRPKQVASQAEGEELLLRGTALAFVVIGWHLFDGSLATVRVLRLVMVMFIVAGALGIFFHYRGNLEFQLEIDPSQDHWSLFKKVIRAHSPPALAPGVMAQLGLLGLAYTYRYPKKT